MKFIHTADLHLGARIASKLPPEKAEERRGELLATFFDIASLADRLGAAVLIAGDIFDTATPTPRTVLGFLDTVRRFPHIRFLCLPGNHDAEGFPSETLPDNLTVFGDSWQAVTVGDTTVYGLATGGDIPYDALTPDPEEKNVVLLHGTVREGGAPEGGTVTLSQLADKGIDYLALGHYHSHRIGRLDARGVWAYSGTPEGRGMDEAGPMGVLIVDTDTLPPSPVFYPTARRKIHRTELDISQNGTAFSAIAAAIDAATADIPSTDLVRIELVGALSPEAVRPELMRLTERYRGRFYYFEIKDKTRLAISYRDYQDSLTLKGEFVRRVLASPLDEEEKCAILRAGFAALRGEEEDI